MMHLAPDGAGERALLLAHALMVGPFGWLLVTVLVYAAAAALQRRLGGAALANPTLLTVTVLCALLVVSEASYSGYAASAGLLHALLGTSVVALAIPMHANLARLRGRVALRMTALALGSIAGTASGVILAGALGVPHPLILSIAPKSATAAVSMEIATLLGGIASVAGCLTIMTGIVGAVVGPKLLWLLGVAEPEARGLALGTAGHGIATARAFSESEVTGAWSALAMSLNAILVSACAPLLVEWILFRK